jgi:hypothetical protein
MIRRAVAAVCLAGCAIRAPTRAGVQACVDGAEANRRGCFQGCEGEFERAFVGCYGRDACTERCESEQMACQAGPLLALQLCGEALDNPRSCQVQLRTERQACAGRPDRVACEEHGRRRAATCWYACQHTHGPALDQCALNFRTCLDGCIAH